MPTFVERADVRVVIAALLLSAGCTCAHDETIASLVEREGDVERDSGDALGEWAEAPIGAAFVMGDGVRTSPVATATLELVGGARLDMEPSTEIRFGDTGDGEAQVEVQTGVAVLESGAEEARVWTELGLAVLEPGSRLRIGSGGRHLEVLVGSAVLEEGEIRRELSAGDEVGEPEEETPPGAPPDEPETPVDPPIGVQVESVGRVTRHDGEVSSDIEAGTHVIEAGTRLTLGDEAHVTIRRGRDRVRVDGAGAIRIGGRAGGPLVEATSGDVHIEASDGAVTLRVPGGSIVATLDDGPSTADIRVRTDAIDVRSISGRVLVREDDEAEAVLASGEHARIERGTSASVGAQREGPYDITLAAGGSVTVHDPAPPTGVRFDVSSACPSGGTVLIAGRAGSATVHRLRRGRHRYRVSCEGGAEGQGSIRVLRDSGRGRLPRTAPASIIDADGRNYTVLYQNHLPQITIRWPDAPSAGSYRLRFTRGGPGGTEQRSRAHFQFPSGRLTEGRHAFVIEAGSNRAPSTNLTIRFDNAASTASVREPAERGFAVGERVAVAGVVVQGWSVAVDGRPITVDGSRRFNAQVTAGARAISVRLSHPRHGVHYYLRRPRSE